MDIHMPVMDGYECTRRIREYEHKNEMVPLPIICQSAAVFGSDIEKATAAGMTGFLAKPVTLAALKEALHEHMPDQEQPQPSSAK